MGFSVLLATKKSLKIIKSQPVSFLWGVLWFKIQLKQQTVIGRGRLQLVCTSRTEHCTAVCVGVGQTKDIAFNGWARETCRWWSFSFLSGGNYDPMYQSLRGAADARRCAQYVSDGYMASSHEQSYEQQQGNNGNANGGSAAMERNRNNSGNYHQQRTENNGGSSSNNVSMTNINNGHGHGHNSGPLPNHDVCSSISSSGGGSHRNSEDFIQGCYQQQQQQQPPPILRYNNHPNAGHYGGNGGNNHELQQPQRAMHIKQNSPALLSIAQTAHQPYSGRSYLNRHNLNLPKLATLQHRTVHRRKGWPFAWRVSRWTVPNQPRRWQRKLQLQKQVDEHPSRPPVPSVGPLSTTVRAQLCIRLPTSSCPWRWWPTTSTKVCLSFCWLACGRWKYLSLPSTSDWHDSGHLKYCLSSPSFLTLHQ